MSRRPGKVEGGSLPTPQSPHSCRSSGQKVHDCDPAARPEAAGGVSIAPVGPRRAAAPSLPEHDMKPYLLASDFDQTLSFNDSGLVLSEMLGIPGFEDRAAGLAAIHLVQQGG